MYHLKHDADSATKEELEAANETLNSLQKGDFYTKHEEALKWLKSRNNRELIEYTINRR